MPARRHGLLRPSSDGRRRPLLGLRTLQHAADLAPFATHLRTHLAANALLPRASEVDTPLVELLVGCEFLSAREAEATLAPHWLDNDDESYRVPSPHGAPDAAMEDQPSELPGDAPSTPAAAAGRLSPAARPGAARKDWQRCTPQETL